MISGAGIKKVFFRSFFIQAAWCFDKMQGLGFVSALTPALDEIYNDDSKRKEAISRYTRYYNSHPYMASPILGAVINLEEKVRDKSGSTGAGPELQEALMGAYGSIGDGFFWASLRPLCAIAGIVTVFYISLWGPLVFLFLYNICHILMRWKGLVWGCALGVGVIDKLATYDLPSWAIRGRYVSAALLGFVSFIIVLKVLMPVVSPLSERAVASELNVTSSWTPMLAELTLVVITLGFCYLGSRPLSVQRLLYFTVLPALIIGIILF